MLEIRVPLDKIADPSVIISACNVPTDVILPAVSTSNRTDIFCFSCLDARKNRKRKEKEINYFNSLATIDSVILCPLFSGLKISFEINLACSAESLES